ncbi:hypothetical protein H8B06_03015 [Sphingobacterium sp. DN00404]|uniref:Uncharacterized protein n=1 Tax=Sphingobacterium micropteri TaxID=2763501 RepID=A0ABR7YKD0_9SPHI|nr:hypothetical protein [Sphingobacterium micropteri]
MIISLASCRSSREKTRLENSWSSLSESRRGIRYGFELIEKDSQNRVWYFATDSMLSFHPDYGLFSKGGQLHTHESRIGLQQLQVEVDSLEQKRTEIATQTREDESRTRYSTPWWFWGLGGLSIIAVIIARGVYGRGQR